MAAVDVPTLCVATVVAPRRKKRRQFKATAATATVTQESGPPKETSTEEAGSEPNDYVDVETPAVPGAALQAGRTGHAATGTLSVASPFLPFAHVFY